MLKPAFGVYGNHDVPGYLAAYGIEDLHDRVAQLNGLTWGGFQGYFALSTIAFYVHRAAGNCLGGMLSDSRYFVAACWPTGNAR